MARDGSGNYSLPSGNPYVNGTVIDETVVNATMSDIGTALSASLVADGQKAATANQPMGTYKHTNVGDAAARNQYAAAGQVQDSTFLSLGSVSGTDIITGSLSPAITSYATRMLVTFTPANANTGAVTIAINGLSAKAIVKGNGTALVANDLLTTVPALILYDGTSFVLLNPAGTLPAYNGSALTNLNASNLASGTVPDGRFPATLPAVSGANLTALPATLPASSGANLTSLNASNLASGTVPDARLPATLPALSGANLTALNASNLASGSIADARVQQSNVTQHQAALTTRNITGKTGTAKTLSTSAPSGGSDGDIWYRYV